ncbi:MAG: pyridoxal phosphate-dependent aminotransferase family protein [Sphingobacteriaceae bacterium]|nr:pyridoxal phosphate-dependent aminotransferase family protein [Cytophagaceae bacterium]
MTTETLPGRTVSVQNQELLWFSGTAYLGMGHVPAFRELMREGLKRYGTGWGSSRHNTLRLAVYDEAEAALAHFVGAPAALTVSSGMLAGRLVTANFSSQTHTIFHAPGVHPALWGLGYEPATESLADWFSNLPERVAASESDHVVIATDSVGSPHTGAVPFEWIRELPISKRVTVVVDDSHGLGIFGKSGEGMYRQLAPLKGARTGGASLIVVSSLNKALGVPAGAIFSDAETSTALKTSPWFGGSSPAAPAGVWAMQHAFGLYREQHRTLLENTRAFVECLGETIRHFAWMPDYPAFTTTAEGFHEFLLQNGILTASFSYPTPADAPITRLVVSALHTVEDLERVAAVCRNYF